MDGLIEYGSELIWEKYKEAEKRIQELENSIEWFKVCFDTAYEGITIVDEHGYIRMMNDAYCRFISVRKEDVIGRYVEEVIENTRLPVVLQTGIPERNQAHRLLGQDMVVHRIPIWKENRVIGAVGMLIFEGVSELYQIFDRMQVLHEKIGDSRIVIEAPRPKNNKVTFDQIIGESEAIAEAKKVARRAAQTSATILLNGESGVGKELFAKAIHSLSPFQNGPLVIVNCASIPENLLESELFGYEEGAFTGSKKDGKPGKFELANKGTLFLDEIGDMPLHMQAKILRVLQEREVERVGGIKSIPVDFRLVAATHHSLEDRVWEGTFRKDLYYRLNVIPIVIPPLAQRRTDIPLLIAAQLQALSKKNNMPPKDIDKEAMSLLINYDWPGNIRELVNTVERLVTLSEDHRIRTSDLPAAFFGGTGFAEAVLPQRDRQAWTPLNQADGGGEEEALAEKKRILEALHEVKGNKSKAAKKLGISRATLYNKLSKYQIS
ncbi:sigma-54-dependent Fis family transcriptional regulator [Brevibacillus sp. HD3.3A]|uniref:sigma-54 interaction domain-containing protein n=1 Tax=Brevibacillus sp. HD3.3A TaxID=2738979 RepID=UPI00156A9908|nr:sigma 54-interacting transcriptional regulator [Brevibacillus sp. HD3.3A]UED70955.1 sigma 54-interacting transcriptional regulator [Brevibacillus sp. HD3.3A]